MDRGIFLNLIFYFDDIEGYQGEGLNGVNKKKEDFLDCITESINGCLKTAKEQDGFHSALSLITKDENTVDQPTPFRPIAHSGMSQAQLTDLKAAQEGKITWAEYFQKWGRGHHKGYN